MSRLLPVRRYLAAGQTLPMNMQPRRYRSNLINWGMLPFLIPEGDLPFTNGDYLFIPGCPESSRRKGRQRSQAYVVGEETESRLHVTLGELTDDEREIILKGCLINYNRK